MSILISLEDGLGAVEDGLEKMGAAGLAAARAVREALGGSDSAVRAAPSETNPPEMRRFDIENPRRPVGGSSNAGTRQIGV
jgi:hypothetical protein